MEPDKLSLVALTPADMPVAQRELADWCEKKAAHCQTLVDDLTKNLEIATRNRWGSRQSLQAAMNREAKRVLYYRNLKAAVDAGYLVIPNFPTDVFAVRVKPEEARRKSASYVSDQLTDVVPKALPAGEGTYVDDTRPYRDLRYKAPDPNNPGQTVKCGEVVVRGYDLDIDFPVAEVKPIVLQAMERAMALRIFDTIGIVRQRKRDPIIVGTLVDPRERWPNSDQAKRVTFFIAWWLNTEDL